MGSPVAWVFLVGVVQLFAWGIALGVAGMMAPHAPRPPHGHRPGTPDAYDWRYTEGLRDLYRIA